MISQLINNFDLIRHQVNTINNNRNSRTRYEICSKLTIKTPEQRH